MLSLFATSLLLFTTAQACMMGYGGGRRAPRLSTLQVMEQFPIMVYGKYVNTTFIHRAGQIPETEGFFRVECTLRVDEPDQDPIPNDLTVHDVMPRHSCDGTRLQDDNMYLLGLKRNATGHFHVYRFGASYPMQNAAVRATASNMARAAGLCSVRSIRMPEAQRPSAGCNQMQATLGNLRSEGICATVLPMDIDVEREARPAALNLGARRGNSNFFAIYARERANSIPRRQSMSSFEP